MLGSSYRIATVWGIPIRIHMSLIVLLLIVALSVGASDGLGSLLLMLALETCVFTSIALHELGHSFVALRKGCRVQQITLMFIGGAAQMETLPRRPRDEFQMAVAGPAVSILLGVLCLVGGARLPLADLAWPMPLIGHQREFHWNFVEYVGVINLMLAAFNLLPSFPMDGGRVLRALLTPKLGRLQATFVAARLGKLLAFVFGGLAFLARPIDWFRIAIAFFIYSAADTEYRLVAMQEAGRGQGYSAWGMPHEEDGEDADEVIVGPPPYEKGPGSRAPLRTERDSFFSRFFRR